MRGRIQAQAKWKIRPLTISAPVLKPIKIQSFSLTVVDKPVNNLSLSVPLPQSLDGTDGQPIVALRKTAL